MVDALLLRALRGGSENALGRVIDRYTAYVCAIIRNTAGGAATREDVEEAASDVFLALWESAGRVKNLKAYLAAIARNKAKNMLRRRADSDTLPLDEELVADGGGAPEDELISADERRAVRDAILAMGAPDREIFLRHYYGAQTVAAIADETGITEAAVKHRLVRGREKLRRSIESEVRER